MDDAVLAGFTTNVSVEWALMGATVDSPTPGMPAPADDLIALRAERDALLEQDVTAWLVWAKDEAPSYRKFETSLSWRITKPVRWAGMFSRKVKSDGLGEALALSLAFVKKRIVRR
jgi:hypothetical protein